MSFKLDHEKCIQDLGYDYEGSPEVVQWAQKELEAHLKTLQRVYGEYSGGASWFFSNFRDETDTHTALLWDVKPLEVEK